MTMKRREFCQWESKQGEPVMTHMEEVTEFGTLDKQYHDTLSGDAINNALRFLSGLDSDQVYAVQEDSSARIIVYYRAKE